MIPLAGGQQTCRVHADLDAGLPDRPTYECVGGLPIAETIAHDHTMTTDIKSARRLANRAGFLTRSRQAPPCFCHAEEVVWRIRRQLYADRRNGTLRGGPRSLQYFDAVLLRATPLNSRDHEGVTEGLD